MTRSRQGGESVSGPKGYDYAVRSAEFERRRAVEEARALCESLRERALTDASEAAAFGRQIRDVAEPPAIHDGATAAEAQRAAAEYAETCRTVAAARDEARADSIARAFARELPATLGTNGITIAWWNARAGDEGTATSPGTELATPAAREHVLDDHDSREQLVQRITAKLVPVVDAARREAWFGETTALLDTDDPATATRLLRALEREVDRELRTQRRSERIRAEADQIAQSIAAIDSPAAQRARESLDLASDRDGLRAAAELARTARAEYLDLEERRFVVEQTIEALAELGYEVEGGFRTTVLEGDFAVAPKAGLREHALQVRFVGDRMLTNTVSLVDTTSRTADIAAEDETCSDLEAVQARLQQNGVILERRHARPSGAVPVERRVDLAATKEGSALRRVQSKRDRTRPLDQQKPRR